MGLNRVTDLQARVVRMSNLALWLAVVGTVLLVAIVAAAPALLGSTTNRGLQQALAIALGGVWIACLGVSSVLVLLLERWPRFSDHKHLTGKKVPLTIAVIVLNAPWLCMALASLYLQLAGKD